MTVTASAVQELSNAGYTAYDQDVPQGAKLPYVWLGRAATQNFDVLDPDAAAEFTFVDVEVWGEEHSQVATSNMGEALRTLFGEWNPGPFGDGVVAGIDVLDQREDYLFRNLEGDDRLSQARLRLRFTYYRELS